jgi:hypothetical protein
MGGSNEREHRFAGSAFWSAQKTEIFSFSCVRRSDYICCTFYRIPIINESSKAQHNMDRKLSHSNWSCNPGHISRGTMHQRPADSDTKYQCKVP